MQHHVLQQALSRPTQLLSLAASDSAADNPRLHLCRQKDFRDGRFAQLTSSALDSKLRDDLERLKKIRRANQSMPREFR